jgi:hypothetical protein
LDQAGSLPRIREQAASPQNVKRLNKEFQEMPEPPAIQMAEVVLSDDEQASDQVVEEHEDISSAPAMSLEERVELLEKDLELPAARC